MIDDVPSEDSSSLKLYHSPTLNVNKLLSDKGRVKPEDISQFKELSKTPIAAIPLPMRDTEM